MMCDALGVFISPLIMVDASKRAVEGRGRGWGDGRECGAGVKNILVVS